MSPQHMQHLFRNGQTALNAGRPRDAFSVAERMMQADHRNAFAWLLRANARLMAGHGEDALQDLKRAERLQPRNPDVLLAAANARQIMGHHDHAITTYDRALRVKPNLPPALTGKARSLEVQGDHKAARAILAQIIKRDDAPLDAAAGYLRLLIRDKEYEKAIALGSRLASNDPEPSKAARALYFAVASAFEKSAQYEQALDWAHRANQTMPVPFNRDGFQKLRTRIISVFDSDCVAALPRSVGHDTSAPVFIIGQPRSGSTLTERILDAHPEMHGVGEISKLHVMAMNLGQRMASSSTYPECVSRLTAQQVENDSRAYLRSVSENAGQARRIIDKQLGNYLHLGLIQAYFPHSRVIHTQRHPLDVCVSCFFERLEPAWVPWASDLDDIAFAYAEYMRVIEHFRDVIDLPWMDVQYESLVHDQEGVSRELVTFCDMPWDDRCLDFHTEGQADRTLSYDQVKQPIYTTALGRAQRFGSLLDPLRDALDKYGVPVPEDD